MIIGKLDRLITIQEQSQSQDTSGGLVQTWSTVVSGLPARLEVVPNSSLSNESDQRVSTQNMNFYVRYPHTINITADMQVVFEGLTGRINSVFENTKAPRRTELVISVTFKDNG